MEEEKKSRIGIKIIAIIIILIVCLFLYARYINPYSLKVTEIAIKDELLPIDYNGLKIVQFSDLHFGRTTNEETLKKVSKEINELNADIIIFTGDLFDNKNISENDTLLMTQYLKEMKAKLFKCAIIGDYDEQYLNTYKSILEDSEFILLDNTSKLIYNNSNTPIEIIGISNTTNIEDLYNNDYYKITLMHKPDLITEINNSHLVFAGHSLGGQFVIPFIGGIKKIEGANTYINSYYQVNDTKLYISNGIGTQDISMRLFNTPSITLYRLYNN